MNRPVPVTRLATALGAAALLAGLGLSLVGAGATREMFVIAAARVVFSLLVALATLPPLLLAAGAATAIALARRRRARAARPGEAEPSEPVAG